MKRSLTAVLAALPFPEGGPPKEFRILRAGLNKTEKGDFVFDEQAAKLVMDSFVAKGIPLVQIDYEHQSMQPPPGGGRADKPAAGWFKPEVRNGELWATAVSWTAKALSMVAPEVGAPEYRYFSPILFFDEESRRVTRLKNLALTNDPAMDDLQPLVAATARKDDDMPCAECAALSSKLKDLEEKCSSLTTQLSAFEKKDKDKDAAMTSLTGVRTSLVALTGQATEAGALGVVEAWKKDAADVAQLRADNARRDSAELEAQLTATVDKAIADGKVEPAKKDDTLALAKGDDGKISRSLVTKLTAFLGTLSPKVSPNGKGTPNPKDPGVAVLTADDETVGSEMGTDLVAFAEWKTKQFQQRGPAAR